MSYRLFGEFAQTAQTFKYSNRKVTKEQLSREGAKNAKLEVRKFK